jgi:transcriptional regulator with XRE-family HTH domain
VKQRYRSLAAYFEQTGSPQIELARALGISKSYISLLVAGERQPSLELALRIEKLTGVPASALVTADRVSA